LRSILKQDLTQKTQRKENAEDAEKKEGTKDFEEGVPCRGDGEQGRE
jgi:hypothetical protein